MNDAEAQKIYMTRRDSRPLGDRLSASETEPVNLSAKSTKSKQCKKGIPCGGSCISAGKKCRSKLDSKGSGYAEATKKVAGKKEGDGKGFKGFKEEEIKIKVDKGGKIVDVPIKAMVKGDFAVHSESYPSGRSHYYTVTHVPSGKGLFKFVEDGISVKTSAQSKKKAIALVNSLEGKTFKTLSSDSIQKEEREELYDAIRAAKHGVTIEYFRRIMKAD